MKHWIVGLLALLLSSSLLAGDRVPGKQWMQYADPEQAGFDSSKLDAAKKQWETVPSSAFMVISNGAVVASWGESDRRFMCHSVRKSFLSGLFGIYWDQGELELNKTLADLGIEESQDPLLETETNARILDLLKARSGVFHPAAYAGRTDSRPRGSEGPGRYFAYNNWDFNTLAAILEKETGDTVFEAFDEHFGAPMQMQDWRITDGYFHYEPDKSDYPAYPFRMSARDAARFGLLYSRDGRWGDQQILSRHWIRRSTALYSIDNEVFGYGFMWWIARQPRFERYGFVAALGVGNQMIAVMPDIDLVIVNRANTYQGEGTPTAALLDLVESILEARQGNGVANPELTPLPDQSRPDQLRSSESPKLAQMAGEYPYPPTDLGFPERTRLTIRVEDGHLVTHSPGSGTFAAYLQSDGWVVENDSWDRYLPWYDSNGSFAGLVDAETIAQAAIAAAAEGESRRAQQLMKTIDSESGTTLQVSRIILDLIRNPEKAEAATRDLAESVDPREIEGRINNAGYQFLNSGNLELAQSLFELNTQAFPDSFNTWDSLGELHMIHENHELAIEFYSRSLELNPDNGNAVTMIETMRAKEGTR